MIDGKCSCLKLVPASPSISNIGRRGCRSAGADTMRSSPFMAIPSLSQADQDFNGVSEPWPPPGTVMFVHVPPWTNFHELPWKSTDEVPWHVVPGPAAQSF